MRKGFTLLELSIVLIIISLVTGMAITSGLSVVATVRQSATVNKMAAIDKALMAFRSANDRLPCPGDLTKVSGSTNYGVEAATTLPNNLCTGGAPAANFTSLNNASTAVAVAEGAVPTATLGLPNDFMYDGWGNHIRYAVDASVTTTQAFRYLQVGAVCGPITVNDANGQARSTGAIYALISHGANGHGAYTSGGVVANSGSTSADELTNCHCTKFFLTVQGFGTLIRPDCGCQRKCPCQCGFGFLWKGPERAFVPFPGIDGTCPKRRGSQGG